jgi:hypothetical protein
MLRLRAGTGVRLGGCRQAYGMVALFLPVPVERTALGEPVHLAEIGRMDVPGGVSRHGVPGNGMKGWAWIRAPRSADTRARASESPTSRSSSEPDCAPTMLSSNQ